MTDCVVITGHLGGLGRSLVSSFVGAGYHVVGIDKQTDAAGDHPQIAFDLAELTASDGEERLRSPLLDAIGRSEPSSTTPPSRS